MTSRQALTSDGDAGDHNLPAQLSPFVGRTRELAEIGEFLDVSRLVTVVGGAGMGKTRLAVELGARTMAAHPDGTWLVRLDSVNDPSLVPQAVASALGLQPEPGRTVAESLVYHLRDRKTLVVLDNCEHVADACRIVVETLLAQCSSITLLATSQQALGVAGERPWLLEPLSLPAGEHSPEDGSDAVALFVARARSVRPGLELTPQLARTVAVICRTLDGIPLAIELAAARVAVLSPVEIAERLEARFKLLTSGPPTSPPRHETLRSALDWSWRLLSGAEAAMLRSLSIFAGGANLDEVEAVCAGRGDVERDDVVDLLASLVAKSLITADTSGVRARYRLLDTVRAYGRERLEDAGEAEATARSHALSFLRKVERQWRTTAIEAPEPRFVVLERDHDNIRAALEWSLRHGEVRLALRLVAALTPFWKNRGYYREGQEWLRRALNSSGEAMPAVRSRALWGLGLLATFQGDTAVAIPAVEESVALSRALGIGRGVIEGLNLRGFMAVLSEDPLSALPALEEALALGRETGYAEGVADTLNLYGRALLFLGRSRDARQAFEECSHLEHLEGEDSGAGLLGLAWLAVTQGRHRDAEQLLGHALPLLRAEGEPFEIALALSFLGELAWLSDQALEATALVDEALSLAQAIGAPYPRARCLGLLGWIAYGEGDGDKAGALMDDSVDSARGAGLRYALVRTLVARGRLSIAIDDLNAAGGALGEAVELARSCADPAGAAAGLHEQGWLARRSGDDERAQALYHEALNHHVETDDVAGIADSLEALAGLAAVQGRPSHGAHLMGASESLRAADGVLRAPPSRPAYLADLETLQAAVEPGSWEEAWAQGTTLTLEEAVSLATRGRGRRDRPLRGWASLTEVERQTAALVADGLTNREAAEKLCVSPRTVQGHLVRIFAKLDVSSRRELRDATRQRSQASRQ